MSSPIKVNVSLNAPWQKRILKDNPNLSALEVELVAFRYGTPEHGRFYHMRRLTDWLFTREHNPTITKPHNWNPWSIRFCQLLCDGDPSMTFKGFPNYMGVTGPKSSGKTHGASLYAFLLWYSSPKQTKVAVSSTSIQAAKNRIWSEVVSFANAVPESLRGYEVTGSNPAMIKIPKKDGGTHVDSIELIAGGDSSTEASGKVLGIKNDWFVLLVDEATEVSHAMFEARHNLDSNPRFQMIFLGNAKSHDDPHGKICEPLDGWDSINVEDEIWQTKLNKGMALHLDGLKSPNMIALPGEPPPYPKLFNRSHIESVASEEGGENSPGFIRFGRGFWSKSGSANHIYSQRDIELNGGMDKPIWLVPPLRILGHDPSFSTDGDNSMAVICELGKSPEHIPQIAHVATEIIQVDDSQSKRHSYAMAERLKEIAEKYGVKIQHLGVDNTGTGASYPEIIDEVFENGNCYRVPFNGPVSEMSFPDKEKGEQEMMFDRRVSELWYIGKLFLNEGQIKGLKPSVISDMTKRLYERGKQNKICVETKRKMRSRGLRSPDEAEAFFIAIALARELLGFTVWDGTIVKNDRPKRSFKDWVARVHPEAKLLINQPSGGWVSTLLKR